MVCELSAMIRLPSISSFTSAMDSSILHDRIQIARLVALSAHRAELLVDHVLLLPLAGDRPRRARLQAEHAAGAIVGDREGQQFQAAVGRALLVADVRLVL